jgi:hypothetical protein
MRPNRGGVEGKLDHLHEYLPPLDFTVEVDACDRSTVRRRVTLFATIFVSHWIRLTQAYGRKAMDLITVFGISALLCVAIGITCSGSRAR